MWKTALAEIGGRDLIVLLDGNAAAVVGLFKTFSYPGEAVKVIELWVASLKKKKKKMWWNKMKHDIEKLSSLLAFHERIPLSGADVMTWKSFHITGLCARDPQVSADIPLTKGQ